MEDLQHSCGILQMQLDAARQQISSLESSFAAAILQQQDAEQRLVVAEAALSASRLEAQVCISVHCSWKCGS